MTCIAHISHVLCRFTYTYKNEIGRQLMTVPQGAAIGPLLSSSPPPHPTREGMYGTEGGHTLGGSFTSPLDAGPPFLRGNPSHVKV